jgi:hypothetical protein
MEHISVAEYRDPWVIFNGLNKRIFKVDQALALFLEQ